MKVRLILASVLALLLLLAPLGEPSLAQEPEPGGDIGALEVMGTAFTYQGQLLRLPLQPVGCRQWRGAVGFHPIQSRGKLE